jgi:hypothetical protein
MGRKSSLTEKQWLEIERRSASGESGRKLAVEFGISEGAIRKRLGTQVKAIKSVANQLVDAQCALKSLPISAQMCAQNLADELMAISMHLASTAKYNAATAHRMAGIANAKAAEIDDAAPLDDTSRAALKDVGVLVQMSNMASEIPINLLKANKEAVDAINKPKDQEVPDGLGHFYGE